MQGSARSKGDPRFRPFRVAMYGLYLVIVVGFSLLVIVSVVRSVGKMTPKSPPPSEAVLTVPECLDRAQALWNELDDHRKQFSQTDRAVSVDRQWVVFRVDWLKRLKEAEAVCAAYSRGREQYRKVFEALDQLMDLYTTHAVQYAGEVGPAVDKFRASLSEARQRATH